MERDDRLAKLEKLKASGVDPYPAHTKRTHTVAETLAGFTDFESKSATIVLAGRLMSQRGHGNLTFGHVRDGSGQIQIAISKKEIGDESYKNFNELADVGDFIEVSGVCFLTHKGEQSLLVKDWRILSKALLPLPEKWHGLKDEEEILRKRYLDILINPQTRELFERKARFWGSMREFLVKQGFLEVETPALENTAGGADARPFVTHHNALDLDVYLRISVGELWQKKLMVAGFEKTFEIGRIFRNEGMSAEHLQDYTSMEYYWAYADWNDGMRLTEELVKYVAQETFGTLKFKIKDFEVDLSQKWATYDYRQTILDKTGLDIEKIKDAGEIKNKLQDLKVEYEKFDEVSKGIDQLWKYCRRSIAGPGWLIYPPKVVSPLAKESAERPGYVERYQLILAGSELCNGYSELNDPVDQDERFKAQAAMREAGDDEAQMHDKDFVEALEHGMPPTTGLGISERLFAFLADRPVRECQIFPLMRPKKVED